MKKYCIVLSMSVFCFACGGGKTDSSSAEPTVDSATAARAIMDSPDWATGEKLVTKSDCFTCHKLADASTGPSYLAVSQKYENTAANQQMLVAKVIAGGSGVWGQIPMAGHPTLSKEDATAMVKYVLLQKEIRKNPNKKS